MTGGVLLEVRPEELIGFEDAPATRALDWQGVAAV